MGLSARALITSPSFPTYPYALSAAQQSQGLVAPAAAVALLGKGGAAAVLLVVFMAATSAMSAELIAVSSIISYDLMGTYWRPLSGPEVVKYSHIIIAVVSIWMGAFALILNYGGVDLGWLFYFQGVICSPAVVPIGLTVCWRRMSRVAALYGTLFGGAMGMLGWMVGCWKIYGNISMTNLALSYSAMCGSLPGLFFSSVAVITLTWFFPNTSTTWDDTHAISGSDAHKTNENITRPSQRIRNTDSGATPALESDDEKKDVPLADVNVAQEDEDDKEAGGALGYAVLQRTFVRAAWISLALCVVIVLLIPMPLFGTGYIFSAKFFTAWIAVSMIWLICAALICIALPIWESREEIGLIVLGLTGLRKRKEMA